MENSIPKLSQNESPFSIRSESPPRVTASGSKKVKPLNLKPRNHKLVNNFVNRDKGMDNGSGFDAAVIGQVEKENEKEENSDNFEGNRRKLANNFDDRDRVIENGSDLDDIVIGHVEKEKEEEKEKEKGENSDNFERNCGNMILDFDERDCVKSGISCNGGVGIENWKDVDEKENNREDSTSNGEIEIENLNNFKPHYHHQQQLIPEFDDRDCVKSGISSNCEIGIENGSDVKSLVPGQLEKEEDSNSNGEINIQNSNSNQKLIHNFDDRECVKRVISSNGGIGIESGNDVDEMVRGRLGNVDSNGGIDVESGNGFDLMMRGQVGKEEEMVFEMSRPISRVYVRRRKKKPDFVEMLQGGVGSDDFRDRQVDFEEGRDNSRRGETRKWLEK